MGYLSETIKHMPRPLRTVLIICYLIGMLYFLTLIFNIPLPLPNYVTFILVAFALFLIGFVMLYGGALEIRQARKEARKSVFYRHMGLYAGIAFMVLACSLLYDAFYPGDILLAIVGIASVVFALLFSMPAIMYSVHAINRTGWLAGEEAKRRQAGEREQAHQQTLAGEHRAEGQVAGEHQTPKVQKDAIVVVMLILGLGGLLVFLASFILLIVSIFVK